MYHTRHAKGSTFFFLLPLDFISRRRRKWINKETYLDNVEVTDTDFHKLATYPKEKEKKKRSLCLLPVPCSLLDPNQRFPNTVKTLKHEYQRTKVMTYYEHDNKGWWRGWIPFPKRNRLFVDIVLECTLKNINNDTQKTWLFLRPTLSDTHRNVPLSLFLGLNFTVFNTVDKS